MRKIIYILISIFVFFGCKKSGDEPTPTPEPTPQTTLMYLTGTDLSYFFSQNLTAAKSAISQNALGDGRFLVFMHSSSTSATLVEYKYENGSCVSETLKSYEGVTSLSQATITEVIADMKIFAEAEKYGLIISGHATGWVPKDKESSWSKVAPMEDVIDWNAMASSPIVTRFLGSTNDTYFDISELQTSLEATKTHFEYILFDACFMSSIEAQYDLRNLCDYIIASPCEIMGAGFPYDTVLPQLFADNGYNYNIQGVCEAYYDYYSTYSFPSGCVAAAVTSELEPLAEIIYQINLLYDDSAIDTEQIQAYERLSGHLFFDLEDYILTKCEDSDLAEQFTEQMAKAYPTECRLHTERFFANIGVSASSANNYDAYYTTITYYSGVSTSAPSSRLTSDWSNTAWAAASQPTLDY